MNAIKKQKSENEKKKKKKVQSSLCLTSKLGLSLGWSQSDCRSSFGVKFLVFIEFAFKL